MDGGLRKGDAALLRFAAAAEILETDFLAAVQRTGEHQGSRGARRQPKSCLQQEAGKACYAKPTWHDCSGESRLSQSF